MRQASFKRARSAKNKRQRATALTEAARAVALENGVASVTLTAIAKRAGVHHSAVRRYFTSHKEMLLRLAAEGWTRWSKAVCSALDAEGAPGADSGGDEPMPPARVAQILAEGLAADPLFCDLLANLHLHLEHEVDLPLVVEFKRISTLAGTRCADALHRALPELGREGALDLLLAAYALASPLFQIAHPPHGLTEAYSDIAEPNLPPEWNLDFTEALTRLLTATCVGLIEQSSLMRG